MKIPTVAPTLFSDINRRMEAWGTEGKMDPFKNIYDLVIQMTVRMASCEELAADAKSVQHMSDLYWKLEKSATPVGLLLPWFPGTAKKNKKQASQGLYDMLSHYVDVRRRAESSNSDAIDVLIADGADNTIIVEVCVTKASPKFHTHVPPLKFVIAVIFAGVVNTGMICALLQLYHLQLLFPCHVI
jgi:sterol 14-demethylase